MKGKQIMLIVAITILICGFFLSVPSAEARDAVNLDSQTHFLESRKLVPGQLNYQGFLVNAADSSAVTATLEMTFRLFDSEIKGAELWSEIHPAVEVNGGLFQVLLGSVTSFPGGLFGGAPLWLQTEVGTEILSPRKPLVSVAYSQRSETAAQASSANWATDAQHAVHADTADYCPGISAWTVDGDNIYRSTGSVGIGTTSPAEMLHIENSGDGQRAFMQIETSHSTNWHEAGLRIKTPENTWHLRMDDDVHNNLPDSGSLGLRSQISDAEVMTWRQDGNVGIGVTSPTERLDVAGKLNLNSGLPSAGAAMFVNGAQALWYNDFYFSWGYGGAANYFADWVSIGTEIPGAPLTIEAVPGTDILFTSTGNNADVVAPIHLRMGTNNGHPVSLMTNNMYRMTVLGTGQVGIGTTSPVSLLEVENHSDTPDMRLDSAVGGAAYLRFSQDDDQKAYIRTNANGDLQLDTSAPGAAGITILNSEVYVGIGTETPARTLHVGDAMRLEPTTAPSSPQKGDMYMDSSTNKLMVYDGTLWQACW
jgi:hypothetical protein